MHKALPKSLFTSLPLDEQLVECFYLRSSELLKPVFYALNDAYPLADRQKNPRLQNKHAEAYNQAKFHRNFYKNIVRDSILPLAKIIKHKAVFEADGPTRDLRCLIENQFRMLHKRLKDYADLLVPQTHVASLILTLDKVMESETFLLLNAAPPDGISHYQAVPIYTDPEGF